MHNNKKVKYFFQSYVQIQNFNKILFTTGTL